MISTIIVAGLRDAEHLAAPDDGSPKAAFLGKVCG
jgi:hypothetical protein